MSAQAETQQHLAAPIAEMKALLRTSTTTKTDPES